ncbi:hypothetical protein [Nostoc sp. KVJ3]|nr:hypothetical protein [Nostoc sp. KVJ3]
MEKGKICRTISDFGEAAIARALEMSSAIAKEGIKSYQVRLNTYK